MLYFLKKPVKHTEACQRECIQPLVKERDEYTFQVVPSRSYINNIKIFLNLCKFIAYLGVMTIFLCAVHVCLIFSLNKLCAMILQYITIFQPKQPNLQV